MPVTAYYRKFEVSQALPPREAGRLRSEAARGLLNLVMLKTGLQTWEPERDERGAPQPKDGWFVSKSHCPSAIAAALAQSPIGIDVEPVRWSRVAEWARVVNASEKEIIGDMTPLSFTRLWTAKEAVLKANGIGVAGLSECRLSTVLGPECLVLRHSGADRVVHQKISGGHVISVYVAGSETVSWGPDWLTSEPPSPDTP